MDISNYRPITLLNTDYKIICKILANRLNPIVAQIIPNHQIGFIPQRLIYDNVICLDLLLKRKTKIINLDFKKAYDSVSHYALIAILHHLKFPKKLVTLIQNLISKSSAQIIINGELTEAFLILRGVKQGDPLSPLLFTLVIELLARCELAAELEAHLPKINGVRLGILMFADDT